MRLWNWIKRLFKKPAPAVIVETPVMAEQRGADIHHAGEPLSDLINDGSPRNPDWDYIATNIKLDDDSTKMGTIGWYYRRFKNVEDRIKKAEKIAKAPWWFIAGIMMRESSFSIKGHFANGDDIIGKGKKTYRWPRGLGPAETWEESVKQAMDYERRVNLQFNSLVNLEMNFGDACAAWEIYNGIGSRSRGEYNSYVTGFTNFHDETGRWIRDHVFDHNAKVVRPGAAGFALYLVKMGDVTRKGLGLVE